MGRAGVRGERCVVLVLGDAAVVAEPLDPRYGFDAILGGGRGTADDSLVVLRHGYLGLVNTGVVGAEAEKRGGEGAGVVLVEESRDP